jgi:hypothetical protein
MKLSLLVLILAILSLKASATAQIPDRLIVDGDTVSLFDCPLEYYPDRDLINPASLFGGKGCFYTACWRNYIATWLIENDTLFLVEIRNACYPSDMDYVEVSMRAATDSVGKEFADLETLFPDRYHNGKVVADWVDRKMISPRGKMLYYIHDGFASVFEKELEFTFENGILTETREYDNSKTRISKYTSDTDLLMEFIRSNINYENVPRPDKEIRVMVNVMGGTADGKVDGAFIIRGYNEIYDREALRVVNSIPEWDVIYRRGEIIRAPWMIPVTFKPHE